MKVEIMPIRMRDVLPLTKMYLSLSEETRKFFHPFPFKMWIVLPIFIYFSLSNKIGKYIQRIAPKFTVISLVAINEGNIVGFAYLCKLRKPKNSRFWEAKNFGIVVHEKYRGIRVGTKLMEEMINISIANGIRKINLTVLEENKPAIRLYKKFGFKIEKRYENRETWNGKRYPDYDMVLKLDV